MKLIPELRFPEFENNGDWKIDSLGNLVEIKGRIGYRGYTRADIVENGKGAITLSPSNFENSGGLNFENCTYITWEKYEESPEIMLEEGQTVLVKTASVGKSAYVKDLPEKATINPQIVVLKPQKIEPRFLAHSIFHNYVQVQIKGAVGAGAIPNMSQDSISKFDILLPPDIKGIEQQKIASCLSSLDELIAAHNDKLDALKDHKKGLLQNLFPNSLNHDSKGLKDIHDFGSEKKSSNQANPKNHGSDNVPKLRFPEFEDDGEWVEKKLNSLSKRVKAKNKDNKFFSVFTNSATDGIVDQREYFDKDIANKKNLENYYVVQDGDYVYNPRISEHAPVGPLFKNRLGKTGVVSPLYTVFRFNMKNNGFYEYYFQTPHWRNSIEAIANTGARFDRISITASLFMEIPVLYTSLVEQQKIASCLSAVDELITAQQEKIEQLQQHKKGLMQGLFPKIVA